MLDDVETIKEWYLLPKIMIYMIGLISTNDPFKELTPAEVWSKLKKDLHEGDKVNG